LIDELRSSLLFIRPIRECVMTRNAFDAGMELFNCN